MPKRMLIDASHPEETRVVVLDGQRVEEFDFEAATKRPLKGNIYLAKVTRVEPSLQAAFVEYGGNRQGFLAFSEIHPDYYQIPVADRMALLADQEAEARSRQEDDIESFDISANKKGKKNARSESEAETAEEDTAENPDNGGAFSEEDSGAEQHEEQSAEADNDSGSDERGDDETASSEDTAQQGENGTSETSEASGENAEAEPVPEGEEKPVPAKAQDANRPSQRWMRRRHYKIQEVIKRRQVILVQVVKEERGNKGAALTTYLSLAGRYCVLMPNTPRGGGISRKITNATDRKRLKAAAQALELPEGMGLIIRTAGENRTKIEIKRDYEYLLRLWDTIREVTLKSNAPACVYEEGDLIKRAIRDLYNKDVVEVVCEGEEGYRNAKDFMRMLMPSHAKNVKQYKEPVPLFQRHHIEAQLDAMFQSTVTLKSGGYIVINQTEALVAIDVNSGRATREHNIEDTATKTNLEAADEVGRQLRLRDLAGLIVIDFIDMEDSRNDRSVEKRLHNAVKNDRARIQIGKISQFGLLELSRQRLRAGVVAGSTIPCPHCGGQGIVRSVESTALRVLRGLEEEAQKQRCEGMIVRVAADVAIYTLNQKRRELARLESDYDVTITFDPKEDQKTGDFEIDRIGVRDPATRPKITAIEPLPETVVEELEEVEEASEAEAVEEKPAQESQQREPRDGEARPEGGRGRRRRRRRGGRDRNAPDDRRPENGNRPAPVPATPGTQSELQLAAEDSVGGEEENGNGQNGQTVQGENQGEGPAGEGEAGRRRRRRRRRGRRGGRDRESGGEQRSEMGAPQVEGDAPTTVAPVMPAPVPVAPVAPVVPAPIFEDRYGNVDEIDTTPPEAPPPPRPAAEAVPNAASRPVWSLEVDEIDTTPQDKPAKNEEPAAGSSQGPTKKGWWQRTFKTD